MKKKSLGPRSSRRPGISSSRPGRPRSAGRACRASTWRHFLGSRTPRPGPRRASIPLPDLGPCVLGRPPPRPARVSRTASASRAVDESTTLRPQELAFGADRCERPAYGVQALADGSPRRPGAGRRAPGRDSGTRCPLRLRGSRASVDRVPATAGVVAGAHRHDTLSTHAAPRRELEAPMVSVSRGSLLNVLWTAGASRGFLSMSGCRPSPPTRVALHPPSDRAESPAGPWW